MAKHFGAEKHGETVAAVELLCVQAKGLLNQARQSPCSAPHSLSVLISIAGSVNIARFCISQLFLQSKSVHDNVVCLVRIIKLRDIILCDNILFPLHARMSAKDLAAEAVQKGKSIRKAAKECGISFPSLYRHIVIRNRPTLPESSANKPPIVLGWLQSNLIIAHSVGLMFE